MFFNNSTSLCGSCFSSLFVSVSPGPSPKFGPTFVPFFFIPLPFFPPFCKFCFDGFQEGLVFLASVYTFLMRKATASKFSPVLFWSSKKIICVDLYLSDTLIFSPMPCWFDSAARNHEFISSRTKSGQEDGLIGSVLLQSRHLYICMQTLSWISVAAEWTLGPCRSRGESRSRPLSWSDRCLLVRQSSSMVRRDN